MAGRWIIVMMALLGGLVPTLGRAAEQPLWEAGAGIAVLQMPHYRGSDERRWVVLPYPYLVYRGDILRVERERISGRIFKTERVLLDFSLSGSLPVKSSNNTARSGMPDLDPCFEVGPSLNVRLLDFSESQTRVSLLLPLRGVFSTDFSSVRREGWVFHPKLVLEKQDLIPKSGVNLGIAAGPLFADSGLHRYFYEVDPAYATAARPTYSAAGGYSGTSVSLGINKKIAPAILNGFVSADFLQGSVIADSPLVKERTSVMVGVTCSWVFGSSQTQVKTDR